MIAIIGGDFERFRPLVDLYRRSASAAGVSPDRLRVGIHSVGFVGETDDDARQAFFPGWLDMMSHLGPERGWPAPTRVQFDAMCATDGPYLIGSPTKVAAQLERLSAALGGVSRVNLQMSSAASNHSAMLRSIELLGSQVKPKLR